MSNSISFNYQIVMKAKNDLNQAISNNNQIVNKLPTNANYLSSNPILGIGLNNNNYSKSTNNNQVAPIVGLSNESKSNQNNSLIRNNIMTLNKDSIIPDGYKKSLRNYRGANEVTDKITNFSNSNRFNTKGLSYEEVLKLNEKNKESQNDQINTHSKNNSNSELRDITNLRSNNSYQSNNNTLLSGLGSKNIYNQNTVIPFGGSFNAYNQNSNVDKNKFFENHITSNNHHINQDPYTASINEKSLNTTHGHGNKQNCKV
jgi:hypothetical protein